VDELQIKLEELRRERSHRTYSAVSNLLRKHGPEGTGLVPLRIAVLRNFTIEMMLPVLEGELALSGIHAVLYLGGYDTIAQEVLDTGSELYAFHPDFILLAMWLESAAPQLVNRFVSLQPAQITAEIERVSAFVKSMAQTMDAAFKSPVLLNSFPLPAYPGMGILDAQLQNSETASVLELNRRVLDIAREHSNVYVMDLMLVAARLGRAQFFDARYWHMAHAPISGEGLIAVGREYAKFARALNGKTRKCLVLDCDNTLWGGIIGEDGINGIKLGTTYPGSCFAAFQKEILNLHDRGVLLALCSKNNEDDVLEVLRRHPGMELREEHFVAREINWDDKPTNLRRIAARLNIGLDSLVFVDDSSFECAMVRNSLPEVAVIELGSEPSEYATQIAREGHFDTLTLSSEDRVRTRMYLEEDERSKLRAAAGSIEEYLGSLGMVACIGPADEMSIPRIAQLTQRTNQFNLTTRRYSDGDIRALAASSDTEVYYLQLRDRVSELGLIGTALVKYSDGDAVIDSFLLSCRAIGRGAEDCLLVRCLEAARERGCRRMIGLYARTAKNGIVARFYSTHGFRVMGQDGDTEQWEFSLDQPIPAAPAWIVTNFEETRNRYANQ
jgi:FkbH-like protein